MIASSILTLWRWMLAAMMVVFSSLIFLQVLIRYVMNFGLFGLNDIIALLAVWMYFFGAAYAAYTNEHISASLVDVIFPRGGDLPRLIQHCAMFLTALVMLVFAWWAAGYAIWSFERHAVSSELKLPRAMFAIPISFGCLMMAVFFAYQIFRREGSATELQSYPDDGHV